MRRPAVALLLALCAMGWVPQAALGADDGGTRSMFDFGAGNRGLGMGSAFVAAVDDASAIAWNTAGLGAVSRGEFVVVQSADLGLGFQDNFASVVFPSWRWGTAALSLRSFGVGDIERRDGRNALLASDLTDQELELAAGYGRACGPAINLGGAFKLRRHSLAGFSASGFGLDLGAQLRPALALGIKTPWAGEWSWGLTLHNLLAPTIRLDQDLSTDPTTVRSGIAWRHQVGASGELLSEVDLETTSDVGVRPSLGAEYRPNSWIAVRAGAEGRGMAAGTSVRWHDVSIDYAFQDAPLAAEHRVGLSFQFGATVEASRATALRREDEALQHRLTKAFRERQTQQVAGLMARAREARGRGDPDEALDALGAVRMLEPDHAEARALETVCLDDKGSALERTGDLAGAAMTYDLALASSPQDTTARSGGIRCRAELDRRSARTIEMRELFARSLDAFVSDHLDSARAGFASLVERNPSDADAAVMLRRVEEAIARRATQARTARTIATSPPAIPAPAKEATPSGQAAPASAASDAKVEPFYRMGIVAWREQRADDALRFWELVWSAHPGYREVNSLLVREYLTRGIDAFAAGRLPEAIAQWEKALRVDPADARARGYLSRAQEQLARSRAIQESR
jgi:tetratricopeptide (TPR) repeat protein